MEMKSKYFKEELFPVNSTFFFLMKSFSCTFAKAFYRFFRSILLGNVFSSDILVITWCYKAF